MLPDFSRAPHPIVTGAFCGNAKRGGVDPNHSFHLLKEDCLFAQVLYAAQTCQSGPVIGDVAIVVPQTNKLWAMLIPMFNPKPADDKMLRSQTTTAHMSLNS